MRLFSWIAVIVLLLNGSRAFSADWTQFRGPGGLGSSDETGLSVVWDDTKNLAWKTPLPGYGASSPIVLGDRIYLTCYSGYGTGSGQDMQDLTLHVVCAQLADGEIVWDRKLAPKLPEEKSIRDHGYAAATPATDGKRLYVFFGKTGVFAFDLEGNQLWQADVGSRTHGWGCGTSPIVYRDLVIVNASVESQSLVALNSSTGEEVWRRPGMVRSWNTPHLVTVDDGSQELVVNVKGRILGFDPLSGENLWACAGIDDYICPSVISHEGVVYAIGGRSSRCIAVKAGGRGDVTETHRLWEAKAGANVSSPVIHGDYLYWVSDKNRVAYCVRRDDGEVVYNKRFKGQPYASTVVADDKLYVVTRYSGTFVLAAKPDFEILSHNEFGDDSVFNASPVVVDGKILIRSDKFLYCVSD